MIHIKSLAIWLLIAVLAVATPVSAIELSGYVAAEGRVFQNDALHPRQKRNNISLAFQPEIYHEWENGSSFTFTPFARLDSSDPERSHFDIREMSYLWLHDSWELRAGMGKVFWGVTEFVHLVDIINQTDLVEQIDGEEKLGQPMLQLSVPRDWGVLDFFLLPYFRERTFPGKEGRLRSQIPVHTEGALYESSAEKYHIDFAVRYSHTIGDWDVGVYHFIGTGREPTFVLDLDPSLNPLLLPRYEQIGQTGVDLQLIRGNWLFKVESLYRTGQGEDFFAGAGGFEYSFINLGSSGMNLGFIGEWAYDERGEGTPTGFDNDLMIGARLDFNDPAGSNILTGFFHDLDSCGQVFYLESGRRFGDNWKVTLEAFFVLESSEDDPIYSLRDDDNMSIELAYYF